MDTNMKKKMLIFSAVVFSFIFTSSGILVCEDGRMRSEKGRGQFKRSGNRLNPGCPLIQGSSKPGRSLRRDGNGPYKDGRGPRGTCVGPREDCSNK